MTPIITAVILSDVKNLLRMDFMGKRGVDFTKAWDYHNYRLLHNNNFIYGNTQTTFTM
ncbi:hypothetical protein [Flagellimonas aequoris]|uniref:hypothetical protein n=1 Tax=Flagellimonas aequoris TaxID=2306997 RepID=UPI0016009F8A|nr:hypothetical protein [Allomuricauda aequoris]